MALSTHREHGKKQSRLYGILCFCFLLIAISPLFFEYPAESGEKLYSIDRFGNAKPAPYGTFCWEFGDAYAYIPKKISLTSSVYPIITTTENPKVRFLEYTVEILVNDSIFSHSGIFSTGQLSHKGKPTDLNTKYFNSLLQPTSNADKIAVFVSGVLFRFNNQKSKDLAEFFNPTDEEQFSKLALIIEEYINKEIGHLGLSAKLKSFNV
jgi:hypothetical protein